jgi:archaellum biogenesis ATPase FlaH
MSEEQEQDSGSYIGENKYCIANEIIEKGTNRSLRGCGSSDALSIFEHDNEETVWYDAWCYSCCQVFNREEVHSSSHGVELGVSEDTGEVVERKKFNLVSKQPPMTKSEVYSFINEIGYKSNDYRGIKDEYSKFYGHLTQLDPQGKVLARYYPETYNGIVTGYKCRNHPKDFRYGKRGATGISRELSGQIKFNSGGKYCLLVGGEEDKAAGYQMLLESQLSRGQSGFSGIPVVSPTTGESSAHKQVSAQYEWFDTYEIIVIGMDNDDVGREAAKKIAEVLPKEKVRIALWSGKDPNKMLQLHQEKQFVRDFYSARPYTKSVIQTSHNLMEQMGEELLRPRITLPPYMHKLQKMMRGGILQGRIVNIIGDTSVGKTTHVNGLFYHLIFNSPEKPGVISLEATAAQYLLDMISLHLGENVMRMGEGDYIYNYLNDPEVVVRYEDLLTDEFGEERFVILDDREGDIKHMERQLEKMDSQYGCRVFVIDVLTDMLRGSSAELQEDHMSWQKNFVKKGNTLINILHTRKPPTDKDGNTRPINEYDALGSSTFVQSAAINILIDRDKLASSELEKNTTHVRMPKCRGGDTGDAGEWYYDMATRQVWDKGDYLKRKK